jgi:hypothetical protein
MTRMALAALLLWLTACAPRRAVSPAENSAETDVTATPVITLERTPCFGSCPVYRLSVAPSGTVTYEGKAHVRKLGTAIAQIPKQRVDALIAELEKGGYLWFANRYTSAEPTCGRYSTDSPSVITSVTISGRTKRIEHDYGCGAAPGALVVLERRIDEALGSAQWTGR